MNGSVFCKCAQIDGFLASSYLLFNVCYYSVAEFVQVLSCGRYEFPQAAPIRVVHRPDIHTTLNELNDSLPGFLRSEGMVK